MRRMKPTTKRKIAAVVAVLLVLALLLSVIAPFLRFVSAAEAEDYTIEAQVGFDGAIKIEQEVPVSVKVTNNSGKTFKGSAAVRTSSYEMTDITKNMDHPAGTVQYFSDIELASGDSKLIKGCIPASTIENYYSVQLIDNKDKIVKEETFDVVTDREESVWLGVMSDSSRTLDEVSRNYTMYAAQMQLDRLVEMKPERIDAIDNLNMLIINDFDMNALSPEEADKIGSWVQSGGVLAIGGTNVSNEQWFNTISGGSNSESYVTPYSGYSAYANGNGSANSGMIEYGKLGNPLADAMNNKYYSDINEAAEDMKEVFMTSVYEHGTGAGNLYSALENVDAEYVLKLLSVLAWMHETDMDEYDRLIQETESYAYNSNNADYVSRIAKMEYDTAYGEYDFEYYDVWSKYNEIYTDFSYSNENDVPSNVSANTKLYVCGSGMIYTFAPDELSQQLLAVSINIDPNQSMYHQSRSSYDYYGLERPGDFLGGFFLAIIMLYAIIIGPVLYFILKKKNKKEKAVKIIPVSALCLTGIIVLCSTGSKFQRPMASVINIVNASSGGVKALNGNAVCAAPIMNELHIKNDKLQNAHMERKVSRYSTDSRAYKISLDKFDYTVYNANKWDTNHFEYSDTIELNGGLDAVIDNMSTIDNTMTVTITNNTGYDLQDICACGSDYNSEYLVAKKLNNGESITTTQVFIDAPYSLRRNDENIKFNNLSSNKRKAAENSNGASIKVTGFAKTDFSGDFKLNGRKASKKEVTAFSNNILDNGGYIDGQGYGIDDLAGMDEFNSAPAN